MYEICLYDSVIREPMIGLFAAIHGILLDYSDTSPSGIDNMVVYTVTDDELMMIRMRLPVGSETYMTIDRL